MDKKKIRGIIILVVGVILLFGGLMFLPDLRPLGGAISVITLGIIILVSSILNKKWNLRTYIGTCLLFIGLISVFGTIGFYDYKAIITMCIVVIVGIIILILGFKKADGRK